MTARFGVRSSPTTVREESLWLSHLARAFAVTVSPHFRQNVSSDKATRRRSRRYSPEGYKMNEYEERTLSVIAPEQEVRFVDARRFNTTCACFCLRLLRFKIRQNRNGCVSVSTLQF